MFRKSVLVLALAAALRVAADAAADKAAEADLVGKLRLAPLATDRINLLSTDDEVCFLFIRCTLHVPTPISFSLHSTSSTPPPRLQ